MDHEFEGETKELICKQQTRVVEALIGKLGPDGSEEDNLNASSVLQDLLEIKEFY